MARSVRPRLFRVYLGVSTVRPMSRKQVVYEFPEALKTRQSLRTVCIAHQEIIQGKLSKDEPIAEFGGCISYIDDANGAEYLGVWGARNAGRFRSILKRRGAEFSVQHTRPISVRLKIRTVATRRDAPAV